MNIQTAIQKAAEITGINAQQVLNNCGIGFNSLGTITKENIEQHTSAIEQIAKGFGISPVILTYLAMSEEDINPSKLKIYQALKPVMDSIIEEILKLKDDGTVDSTNRES